VYNQKSKVVAQVTSQKKHLTTRENAANPTFVVVPLQKNVQNLSEKSVLFLEKVSEVNYMDMKKNTYIDSRMMTIKMATLF
jgi:hypothetical protein